MIPRKHSENLKFLMSLKQTFVQALFHICIRNEFLHSFLYLTGNGRMCCFNNHQNAPAWTACITLEIKLVLHRPCGIADVCYLLVSTWVAWRGLGRNGPSKYLEHVVILCFERWYPKKNNVIRPKSNISPPECFTPQMLWLATLVLVSLLLAQRWGTDAENTNTTFTAKLVNPRIAVVGEVQQFSSQKERI